MYSGRAKSNDAARNQVRAGENVSPQAHIKAIETDQWMHPEVQEYRNVKDELLVYQGTELRGNRIVVPKVLRDKAVNLAHVGYQGIAKLKRLIRQIIWFPAVEKMAKVKKSRQLFTIPSSNYQQGRTIWTSKDDTATKHSMERTHDGFSETTSLWRVPHGRHRQIQLFLFPRIW